MSAGVDLGHVGRAAKHRHVIADVRYGRVKGEADRCRCSCGWEGEPDGFATHRRDVGFPETRRSTDDEYGYRPVEPPITRRQGEPAPKEEAPMSKPSAADAGRPTPHQQRVWDAVARLGTQGAAARELGMTQGSIQGGLAGYMARMGIEGDLHVRRSDRPPLAQGAPGGARLSHARPHPAPTDARLASPGRDRHVHPGHAMGNPYRVGDPMPAAVSACGCRDCTPDLWVPGRKVDWEARRTAMTLHDAIGAYLHRLRSRPIEWLEPLRRASWLACWCRLDEPCHVDAILERLEETRPIPRPGERPVMGIHSMPGREAEGAPAWPSPDDVESVRERAYGAWLRGARR